LCSFLLTFRAKYPPQHSINYIFHKRNNWKLPRFCVMKHRGRKLSLIFHIWEVTGSVLGPEPYYSELGSSWFLSASCGKYSNNIFRKATPTSFSIHPSQSPYNLAYEGVSKSYRTGRLERELQIVQLYATRCSCIAVLWVSRVSFAAITLCITSQRVLIVVVYFVIDSVRKLLDTPSYVVEKASLNKSGMSQGCVL
jgi:hypothetical protein